jgi:cytochrome c oxidase assembly factor CtaG
VKGRAIVATGIAIGLVAASVTEVRGVFTIFAVQHLLLSLVVAPLVVSGLTWPVVRQLGETRGVGPLFRAVKRPWRGFALFHVTVAVLLLPPVLEWFHRSALLWPLHRALVLVAALFLWWPLLAPEGDPDRLPRPMQMLYAFLSTVPTSLMAVILARAPEPIYSVFTSAPERHGMTVHEDQMLGALIMWVPALFIYFGAISWSFWRWQKEEGGGPTPSEALGK